MYNDSVIAVSFSWEMGTMETTTLFLGEFNK